MANIDVIKDFIIGIKSGGTISVQIDGDKLICNKTCIAERTGGNLIIVNLSEYNPMTKTVQNNLVNLLTSSDYDGYWTKVYDIPHLTKSLI